eukprot:TRINITY_DN12584_c0_g1_i1.p1 TRINITY_DN12584_c0_g1~~TRINITY_DN12584_c0_g1_i1.p1  ORF type:complete len:248 (-),score=34.05 TRINITY_DN12584_c0_g1_i1:122-865(-)
MHGRRWAGSRRRFAEHEPREGSRRRYGRQLQAAQEDRRRRLRRGLGGHGCAGGQQGSFEGTLQGWCGGPSRGAPRLRAGGHGEPQLLAGRPSRRRAAKICSELCQAVAHMHRKGLAHRDIKLENVMLVKRGMSFAVVLADLGLSKSVEVCRYFNTRAGTQGYLAPEVWSARDVPYDAFAADVYALGKVLEHVQSRCTSGKVFEVTDRLLATDPNLRMTTDELARIGWLKMVEPRKTWLDGLWSSCGF